MVQAHQTALCNAAHSVEARIARSLLEVLDRSDGVDVPLTQTTLAQMLGVQRTTINLAAGRLEAEGVINCRRGHMHVVRREELERHACECYQYQELRVAAVRGPGCCRPLYDIGRSPWAESVALNAF
jgi:DNA-binding GntR family transcriptional regulator